MKKLLIPALSTTLLLSVSSTSFAHAPNEVHYSFSHGLVHLFTGIDHLLVMIAIGFIAVRSTIKIATGLIATAMAALFVGAAVSINFAFQPVEFLLYTSAGALVVSALMSTKLHLSITTGFMLLAAVFHGAAHGATATPLGWEFVSGIIAASLFTLSVSMIAISLYDAKKAVKPIPTL